MEKGAATMSERPNVPQSNGLIGVRLDRRRFLRLVALTGAAENLIALGTACGPASAPQGGGQPGQAAQPAAESKPVAGAKPADSTQAQAAPGTTSSGQVV